MWLFVKQLAELLGQDVMMLPSLFSDESFGCLAEQGLVTPRARPHQLQ